VGLGACEEGAGGARVAAILELEQLFSSYGAGADEGDRDLLAGAFAAAAEFVNVERGGPTIGPLNSRQEIVDLVQGASADPARQLRHVITNVRLDGAVARANLVLFVTEDGAAAPPLTGVYEAETTNEEGRLCFSRLLCTLDRPL
jgi:hypothetical protein